MTVSLVLTMGVCFFYVHKVRNSCKVLIPQFVFHFYLVLSLLSFVLVSWFLRLGGFLAYIVQALGSQVFLL